MSEILSSFVGTTIALALGYAALRKLSSWFIEQQLAKALDDHRHELNTKLTRLEVDLGRMSDVLSRRNEREFAVVETAWDRMMQAVGEAQRWFSPMRESHDFAHMEEPEAVRIISTLPLADEDKAALFEAGSNGRNDLYERMIHRHGTREAMHEWGEFKNWLNIRQIFLTEDIHAQFVGISEALIQILSVAAAYASQNEALPTARRVEFNESLHGAINENIDTLGRAIRRRFGFEQTEGNAGA